MLSKIILGRELEPSHSKYSSGPQNSILCTVKVWHLCLVVGVAEPQKFIIYFLITFLTVMEHRAIIAGHIQLYI